MKTDSRRDHLGFVSKVKFKKKIKKKYISKFCYIMIIVHSESHIFMVLTIKSFNLHSDCYDLVRNSCSGFRGKAFGKGMGAPKTTPTIGK